MKSVSKKIEKLNIAVKVFDDEISIENKLLQRTKDKHKELIQTQVLINERLQEMGISPSGAITGHQLQNFSDYRKKLTDSIKHIEQTLAALNIEIQAKSENLRKLVAKKTAALAMIDKLKKHKEKAEEKSLQQIAEIMHTVKNFNQEGAG